MPPKRKLSTPKSVSSTSIKPAAAAIRTSPMAKRRNSLAGGKTSRLAPSEPLHMTTRRAAKTASNHTSPVAPSSATSGSRRSSLNDVAHFENAHSDTDDERPAKRSRLSTGSPQVSHGSFAADQTPLNGAQTPELPQPEPEPEPEPPVTSTQPKPSSKKRRASDDSMQSTTADGARPNGLLTRSQSDPSEQQPRRKKRKTTEPPADLPDQPPELTDDASSAPNSPEQIAEVESSQVLQNVLPTVDAPTKLGGRRLPGRRRQPHSDINVETDLRRQLNLKMSYRSLAKVHKTILEELSNRTINNLENEPDFYRRCPEYEPLMASLDEHRDKRLAQVNALRTNKLEQLERVRVATEHIEREQYINRFRDLQDDFLLQCYYRMKQLEREMKRNEDAATDDEDNILEATYTDAPASDADDRISSKFASRSRAYVEAERLLDGEGRRKRFDLARKAFVDKNEDADDSIGVAEGFATFVGPDRAEAIAHYNIACLTDATHEVETTPPPPPPEEPPKVISNEEADALFMLASLSADQPRGILIDEKHLPEHNILPPIRELTPMLKEEPNKEASPIRAPPAVPLDMTPLQLPSINPNGIPQSSENNVQGTPHHELNGTYPTKESTARKSETPARVSTHRIMDLLNDDQEVRPPKSREYPNPMVHGNVPRTPSQQDLSSQTPAHSGVLRLDAIVHNHEQPVGRHIPESSIPILNDSPASPYSSWASKSLSTSKESEESLKRRDPLLKIREMLDRKARIPPERSDYYRRTYESSDPTSQPVQVLSSAFTPQPPQERSEPVERDARKHSTSAYGASPNAGTLSYNQSPGAVHAYPSSTRHGSQDHSTSHWDRDRRMSGSQAIQPPGASPYQGTHAQPYQGEHNTTAPSPPKHQSTYPPPPNNVPSSLPPKPPGPSPSGPTNFRFAHYDPAPSRTYPPPPASGSYPPSATLPPPPPSGPPPPAYTPGYSGPPAYQSGYVPPPGSFQAPPPPPPPPSQSVSSYPPLKIHQYGGQPILPATLAPPPPQSQPMTFVGQAAPPPSQSYSPPQQPAGAPRNSSYDAARDGQSDRPADPQSRPRRQYRSYHAPGTQFRSYQGPDSGRRRGG